MFRREFLQVVLGLFGQSFMKKKKEEWYTHPILGRLLEWECIAPPPEYYELDQIIPYRRFICFPLVRTLRVKFEHLSMEFTNFNCSFNLAERINNMPAHELGGKIALEPDGDCRLTFEDNHSVMDELCPEKINYREMARRGPRTEKFVLVSAWATGTEQSQAILQSVAMGE